MFNQLVVMNYSQFDIVKGFIFLFIVCCSLLIVYLYVPPYQCIIGMIPFHCFRPRILIIIVNPSYQERSEKPINIRRRCPSKSNQYIEFMPLLGIIMLNKVLAYHIQANIIIFYSVLTERNSNGPHGYCKLHSEIFVHVRGHFRRSTCIIYLFWDQLKK